MPGYPNGGKPIIGSVSAALEKADLIPAAGFGFLCSACGQVVAGPGLPEPACCGAGGLRGRVSFTLFSRDGDGPPNPQTSSGVLEKPAQKVGNGSAEMEKTVYTRGGAAREGEGPGVPARVPF